ncbi:hypothetical protein AD998_13555 [bacterium 336/3]|nr:hypothetical protein AD998_13555 [bacterium 336/3]
MWQSVFATTWDEPWQDKIMKEADYFVFAKVLSVDEEKGMRIKIIKQLAGSKLDKEIFISGFYLLRICSMSGGHGPEFKFETNDELYLFIKQDKKGNYEIPTPTSGFAYIYENKVAATYRHSYHQALIDIETYEKTMIAIFNNYHNQSYDKKYINSLIDKYLGIQPVKPSKENMETFYYQHVALECIYHLRLTGFFEKINPFVDFEDNPHLQISAVRALIAYNTQESKNILMKFIENKETPPFLQVMCIWSLRELKPKELKEKLQKISLTASEEDSGFGGNFMDPRVCTHVPTVKEAIEELVSTL